MSQCKFIRFEIESTTGTRTDLSKHFKSATVYDENGDVSDFYLQNNQRLAELDAHYEKVLAEIVARVK